jgi:hypothetical protein
MDEHAGGDFDSFLRMGGEEHDKAFNFFGRGWGKPSELQHSTSKTLKIVG